MASIWGRKLGWIGFPEARDWSSAPRTASALADAARSAIRPRRDSIPMVSSINPDSGILGIVMLMHTNLTIADIEPCWLERAESTTNQEISQFRPERLRRRICGGRIRQ